MEISIQDSNRVRFRDYPKARFNLVSSLEIGNRSTAQSLRVGESPLNGNGVPLTSKVEGEDIDRYL